MIDDPLFVLGSIAWALAAAAVVLGRNLTRSVVIGYAFVALLCVVLLMAGAGFLAAVLAILSALALATIQVFGWMLVDVDRDHLSPTDSGTWIARGLAFVVLAAALSVLVVSLLPELIASDTLAPIELGAIGRALFGPLGGATLLLGLAIAAALLATMLLLRDEEEG